MINHVTDFIIRVKNASHARRQSVVMPYSNINKAIAKVLVKEGYLADVKEETVDGKKQLVAALRFVSRRPVVRDVEILSKPSLRTYSGVKELGEIRTAATTIISTSKGIMTGKEALKKGLGGELLFRIW